jgi:hypothetical protein
MRDGQQRGAHVALLGQADVYCIEDEETTKIMPRMSGTAMPVQEDAAQEDAGKWPQGRLVMLCKFSVLDWIRVGLFRRPEYRS